MNIQNKFREDLDALMNKNQTIIVEVVRRQRPRDNMVYEFNNGRSAIQFFNNNQDVEITKIY